MSYLGDYYDDRGGYYGHADCYVRDDYFNLRRRGHWNCSPTGRQLELCFSHRYRAQMPCLLDIASVQVSCSYCGMSLWVVLVAAAAAEEVDFVEATFNSVVITVELMVTVTEAG